MGTGKLVIELLNLCSMIIDKDTLSFYLDADKFALGYSIRKPRLFKDTIWRYEILLRKYEYCLNTNRKLFRLYYAFRLQHLGIKLGFSISANVFGPGLRINHSGLLVINANARIGKWCDIHQGVNIGSNDYKEGNEIISCTPYIGDRCYIGPGAKIFGGINIGNDVQISANAVISKDVPNDCIAVGNPFVIKSKKKKIITIADSDFEINFLLKYPQYTHYLVK